MNIEISVKEYRDLLDILHIADVVMSGHRREEDKRTEQHRALIQKLYGLAKGEGLGGLMRVDEGVKKVIPTAEFEQRSLAHVVLDEFGHHIFWDHLITELTARDAAQMAGGMERFSALSDADRHVIEGPIRQRYVLEFSANGVANLEVVERLGSAGAVPVKTSD